MSDEMSTDELVAFFGETARQWADAEISATRRDAGRVEVWCAGELIGFAGTSARFPELLEYSAVITADQDGGPVGVPFPAGFVPPDPLKARESERRRWLPSK